MSEEPRKTNVAVRAVVDFSGLAAFTFTYLFVWLALRQPINAALLTAAWPLVIGSVLGVVLGLAVERRVAPMPLFTCAAGAIFGGLALVLHDPRLLYIKPTAINLVLAAIMLVGTAMGRNPLKALFAAGLHLTPQGWRKLAVRYGLFFLAMAALNEVVWRVWPKVWAPFHFPGLPILSILFALTQVPMMMKDMKSLEAAAEMEP
jgi:intracellular septation protein